MQSPSLATETKRLRRLPEPQPLSGPAVVSVALSRDLIRELIAEVLTEVLPVLDWPVGRIALTEEEAAKAVGVSRHVLRDLRLGGSINAARLGKRVVYTRDCLLEAINVAKRSGVLRP